MCLMEEPNLLYNHKFIDPNVSNLTDNMNDKNIFKENGSYKLNKVQNNDLNLEEYIDLDKKRIVKERITLINIDSRDRNKTPKNIYDKTAYKLKKNPIEFSVDSDKIIITVDNHNFKLNERVSMINVIGRNIKIRNRLYLKQDSFYAKIIDENHDMTFEYGNNNIFLELSNVKGNIIEINSVKTQTNKLSNIPINLFNQRHEILFIPKENDYVNNNSIFTGDPIVDDPDVLNLLKDIDFIRSSSLEQLNDIPLFESFLEQNLINGINPLGNDITNLEQVVDKLITNFYLIRLPVLAEKDYIPDKNTGFDLENSCIKINFLHLFGINTSFINADYPLSLKYRQGNHRITKIISEDKIEITLLKKALDKKYNNNPNRYQEGGSCIELSKVINVETGYPDPNHYNIFLKRTFNNVKIVELISCIFPNTEKVFRQFPNNKRNNKLYWNILDDGETIYNLCITPGNYTPQTLEQEIEKKAFELCRTSYETSIDKINSVMDDYNLEKSSIIMGMGDDYLCPEFIDLSKNIIMDVSINIDTDIVNFSICEIIYMRKCIGLFDSNNSTFTVFHPDHPFTTDDENITEITISGSTDIRENSMTNNTFPESSINGNHTIVKIIDTNSYQVTHDRSIIEQTTIPLDNGGDNIEIKYPIKFRLLFNYSDTMGKELGFNLVGEPDSISPFNYIVSNVDFYQNEINFNSLGIIINRKNLSLALSGSNYFFMTNETLSNFNNTGRVDNIFAKIQLQDIPNTVLYNTFVNSPKIFEDPLTSLSELEFRFYSYDGELYDFNGVEHSFCLRIVELVNLPIDSHINTRTGAKLQTFVSDFGNLKTT